VVSKDRLIVVSRFTENYFNKTAHISIICSLIILQDPVVSGASVASDIVFPW
jgi:hypothetical protein